MINILKSTIREKMENHKNVAHKLRNHFSNLLSKHLLNRGESIRTITRNITFLILYEKNLKLMRNTTYEDVSQIVQNMAVGKYLGLDVFAIDLFQLSWPII
jgi:hypothetical protein